MEHGFTYGSESPEDRQGGCSETDVTDVTDLVGRNERIRTSRTTFVLDPEFGL